MSLTKRLLLGCDRVGELGWTMLRLHRLARRNVEIGCSGRSP